MGQTKITGRLPGLCNQLVSIFTSGSRETLDFFFKFQHENIMNYYLSNMLIVLRRCKIHIGSAQVFCEHVKDYLNSILREDATYKHLEQWSLKNILNFTNIKMQRPTW